MSIDEVMTNHGFNFSASCGGKGSYTKWIKHRGKRAYIAITDATGESFPTTLEEPDPGGGPRPQVGGRT